MEYREAIQADPNFAVAHVCLGLLFLKTGRPEEAEKERRVILLGNRETGRGKKGV